METDRYELVFDLDDFRIERVVEVVGQFRPTRRLIARADTLEETLRLAARSTGHEVAIRVELRPL
jgi:hypothetical protein